MALTQCELTDLLQVVLSILGLTSCESSNGVQPSKNNLLYHPGQRQWSETCPSKHRVTGRGARTAYQRCTGRVRGLVPASECVLCKLQASHPYPGTSQGPVLLLVPPSSAPGLSDRNQYIHPYFRTLREREILTQLLESRQSECLAFYSMTESICVTQQDAEDWGSP